MVLQSTRNLFLALSILLSTNVLFSQNRTKQVLKQPTSETMKVGAFIDVNAPSYPQSSFSITQLVTNVLIAGNSTCTTPNVSNVVVSPNLSASDLDRSWGYFNKGTTNFPFSNGIVLTTGQARRAGNNFQSGQLSDILLVQGDADLATALNLPASALKDASFIEFDFVPTANQISFRYIFASEEYEGNFPCSITDGFALLLKPVGGTTYTNLAVLPGGAGPVSVTNIIPSTYACGPKNAQYFGGQNTANIETNFSGRTVPMIATANVVAGQAYHIKMVLADYQDSAYDSGVFLEAGSFDIGVQIQGPNGVQLPSSINVCDNAPQTFTASVQSTSATYQWYLNNVAIPGATNATYTATQPGVYQVVVMFPGSSCPGTASVTIVGGTSPTVQNATLTACYTSGNAIYDLTAAQSAISSTPGVTYSYYQNLADANAGNTNTIANPTAYSSAGGQTIYVLVKNGFCSKVAQLQLVKAPQITASIVAPPALTCTTPQITLDASASVYSTGATFAWTTVGGNIVSGANTLNPIINAPGTYTLTISNTYQPGNLNCIGTATVTVTGNSNAPTATLTASKIQICSGESVTLTAGGGSTYNWGTLPGTGSTQTVSPTTTTTYSVVAVGANGCSSAPATITIEVTQSITVQNATLLSCYSPTGAVYNLTSAQSQITTAAGATFAYYANQADANAGNTNTIANPTAYSSPGNQTVYVQVKNGACTYVVTLQLNMTPVTTLNIAAPATITCTTPQITLNASSSTVPAGSTITWTASGGGNIVSGGTTLSPVVNAAGTYTLTVANTTQPGNLTCTFTSNVTVIANTTAPAATLTASKVQICSGESVVLTAGGGVTYNWGTLPGTGNTQTVNPTTTTTYSVTAISANGCPSSVPATVTIVVTQPITVQNASLLACYSPSGVVYDLTQAQTQITSASGVTFSYYVNQADANAGNTNTIATPTTFSSSGNQTVYVRVVNGACSYVVSLQLNMTPVTTLNIAAPATITCTTPQITLNASASTIPTGSTVVWTTTGGGNIVSGGTTLNPVVNAAGTYTLTVTNTNQPGNLVCTYTANTTVTVNTVAPITIVTANVPQICPGESVTLTASGGATYNWTGLPGNGNIQVVSPTVTTSYTVAAVGANGCISTQPATITIIVGPPTAALVASKTKICAGESVTLTASGGVTYNWVGLTGNGNTQVVSPTTTTTYQVYALGGNGCTNNIAATVTIQVVPAITSNLQDLYVCAGDEGTLDAGSGPNYAYIWSTGATTQTISTAVTGTYTVTISNGTCTKVFTAQLLNPALPQFTNVTYADHVLTIFASNPNNSVLEYSIDNGLNWQTSNIFYNVSDNLSYTLRVRNQNAECSNTTEFFTFVVVNAITPNRDGINEGVDFSGISGYNNFSASVFDRYGAEIFRASKNNLIWDGTLRGMNIPTGSYWYKVQWENPVSKKIELRNGWILVKNRN